MPAASVRSEHASAWMLVPASREPFDGIRDYAAHLADALGSHQTVVTWTTREDVSPRPGTRVESSWRALRVAEARPDVIYLHYLPQAWLRRDVVDLFGALAAMRRAGTRVIVVVHEYQLDPGAGVRRAAARLVFDRLARALARRADVFVTTHGFIAGRLREDGLGRLTSIVTIPVGSNVPDVEMSMREPGCVVMFGQPAGMQAAAVRAAACALREAGHPPLVWICRSREEADRWLDTAGVGRGEVMVSAGLDGGGVAAALASASVGLAPIVDGVSTRRTTVAALLQHRLPIVGLHGRATDPLFRQSAAFTLSPLDAPEASTQVLVSLLADSARREAMSRAARELFDAHLTWPSIARQFLALAA